MNSRAVTALVIGSIFASTPITVTYLPYEVVFPTFGKISAFLFGLFMMTSGLTVIGAERYKSLVDILTILGIVLLASGPVTSFPFGTNIWNSVTLLSAVFLALPATLLFQIQKKDV